MSDSITVHSRKEACTNLSQRFFESRSANQICQGVSLERTDIEWIGSRTMGGEGNSASRVKQFSSITLKSLEGTHGPKRECLFVMGVRTMATILVTPRRDGNIVIEVRRAVQELELRGIAAQGLAQTSRGRGLIRVADDVESEALTILNGVPIAVSREAGRTQRK